MGTYNNPDDWSSLNDQTAPSSIYTCLKGTPGVVGSAYIKLISKTVTGMGVVPAIAVSGTLDMITRQAMSGFAFNERPESFAGKWQYMAYGSDQGFIAVALTKWNSMMMQRDTVAMVYHTLPGMVMSWANFSIPLVYMSGDTPDSCIIVLSASQANGAPAAANSYLYADEIGFTGLVAGVKSDEMSKNISFSPNPFKEVVNLNFSKLSNLPFSLEIYDLLGNKVKAMDQTEISAYTTIQTSNLSKGVYMLHIHTSSGTISKKIIKQ